MNRLKKAQALFGAGLLAVSLALTGPNAYATSQGLKDAKEQVSALEADQIYV